jgi:hypothetical protein
MGFFSSQEPQQQPQRPDRVLPILPVELTKRYDVYIREPEHDRLYENVRFVCLRTFDRITEYSGTLSSYLEIESSDGTRCLIPTLQITAICEHGVTLATKILRRRRGVRGD